MSKSYLDNHTPDFGDYSLDAALSEYRSVHSLFPEELPDKKSAPISTPHPPESAESIAARSRHIAMESVGRSLLFHQSPAESSAENETSEPQESLFPAADGVFRNNTTKQPQRVFRTNVIQPTIILGEDGVITLRYPERNFPSAPVSEPEDEIADEAHSEEDFSDEDTPEKEYNTKLFPEEDIPDDNYTAEPSYEADFPEKDYAPEYFPEVDFPDDSYTAEPSYEADFPEADYAPEYFPEVDSPENNTRKDRYSEAPSPKHSPKHSPVAGKTKSKPEKSKQKKEKPPQKPAERAKPSAKPPKSAPRPSPRTDRQSREKLPAPVRLLAALIAMRQSRHAEAANWPDPAETHETPELSPAKAAKFYIRQAKPYRFRCRVSAFLCIILAWIAFQFPMAGMLGCSTSVQAGLSLVLTLAVMVVCLDIVATGAIQLMELHPGTEAVALLSAVFSCLDGALVMIGHGTLLPFCAVSAVSLTAALWGQRLRCTALARTFKTVATAKSPTVITTQSNVDKGQPGLLRANIPVTGIVRRSEAPDMCQNAYAAASPFFLGAALLLAIAASLGGNGGYFLHTFSALLAVSASFSAFIAFPLPYASTARKLRASGVAIAGFTGCAALGKTGRIIISDSDLFPPGTVKFSAINVADGASVRDVVSYTASLITAAGSGIVDVFNELMTRRQYELTEIYDFRCHQSGGLSAVAEGHQVLVGPVGYMNLNGIRLPKNMNAKYAICTAIDRELVGVFVLDYHPVTGVQDALITLLRGKTTGIFAIRDFNISPMLVRQLFRMPTENFNFPSFLDRYRISGITAGKTAPVQAVANRKGLMTIVDAAESGRKLYFATRINTILTLIGSVLGLAVLFLLCRAASFDTASVGNVLTFMLLWTAPIVILSIGQGK